MRRVEFVGPQVGKELAYDGIMAVLIAMFAILIYVTFRFELRFALGADVALLHDVTMVLGLFALTGKEFNLPVVAALLTVIGYSLNDTIVVFDRKRHRFSTLKVIPRHLVLESRLIGWHRLGLGFNPVEHGSHYVDGRHPLCLRLFI